MKIKPMTMFESFFNALLEAQNCIAQYRSLMDFCSRHSLKSNGSIVSLINNVGYVATIRLSNIYGKSSEENHWDKLLSKEEREQIYSQCFGSNDEYELAWKTLCDFRIKVAVHYTREMMECEFPRLSEFQHTIYLTVEFVSKKYGFVNPDTSIQFFKSQYEEIYRQTQELFGVCLSDDQ